MSSPAHACRYCQAEVLPEAAKCRHCGEWLRALCPHCGGLCDPETAACPTCSGTLEQPVVPRHAMRMLQGLAVLHMGFILAAVGSVVKLGCEEEVAVANLVAGLFGSAVAALVGWMYWRASRNLNVILIGLLTALYLIASLAGLARSDSPGSLLVAVLMNVVPFLVTAYCLYQALVWHRQQSAAPVPMPTRESDSLPEFLLKRRFWFPPAEHIPGLLAWVITFIGVNGVLGVSRTATLPQLALAFGLMAPLAYVAIYRLRLLGSASPELLASLRQSPTVHAAMGALTFGAILLMPRETSERTVPVAPPTPIQATQVPQSPVDPWAEGADPLQPMPGVLTPDHPVLPVCVASQWFLLPLGEGGPRPVWKVTERGLEQGPTVPVLPADARQAAALEPRALVECSQGLYTLTAPGGIPTLARLAGPAPQTTALLLEPGRVARAGATSVDILDAGSGALLKRHVLPRPRREAAWYALTPSRLIAMGGLGSDGAPAATLEHIYTDDFFVVPGTALPTPLRLAQVHALPGGQLGLLGGLDAKGTPGGELRVYHPKEGFFLTLATLKSPRTGAQLSILGSSWLLVAGGRDAQGRPIADVERIHLDKGKVQNCRPAQAGVGALAALPLADGSVMVLHCGPRQAVYRIPPPAQ